MFIPRVLRVPIYFRFWLLNAQLKLRKKVIIRISNKNEIKIQFNILEHDDLQYRKIW